MPPFVAVWPFVGLFGKSNGKGVSSAHASTITRACADAAAHAGKPAGTAYTNPLPPKFSVDCSPVVPAAPPANTKNGPVRSENEIPPTPVAGLLAALLFQFPPTLRPQYNAAVRSTAKLPVCPAPNTAEVEPRFVPLP